MGRYAWLTCGDLSWAQTGTQYRPPQFCPNWVPPGQGSRTPVAAAQIAWRAKANGRAFIVPRAASREAFRKPNEKRESYTSS